MDHTAQMRQERENTERLQREELAKKGERATGFLLIHEGESRQQRRARERQERKDARAFERKQKANYEIDQMLQPMTKTQRNGGA